MLKWKALAAVLSIMLLGMPCVAGQQNSQLHANQRLSSKNKLGLPPSDTAIANSDLSNSRKTTNSDQVKHDPEGFGSILKKPEWVIVYITAAYTIVSLAALMAILWQVVVTKDTARRQLRAYVLVERGIIGNVANPIPGPGEKIETVARILLPTAGPNAQITIKNTGQTPAYELVHWGRICIQEFPLTSQLPPMPTPEAKFWTVMGPGIVEVKTLRLPKALDSNQIQGLRDGTMAIYCHGEVAYRDAFKKKRVTKYRCMYSAVGGIIGVNTDLTYCDDGNTAT
jgi:hypothetical protein